MLQFVNLWCTDCYFHIFIYCNMIAQEATQVFFQFFSIDYVSCEYMVYGLYCVEVCSFYIHFVKGFYHERMLYFVKCFFCLYWDDHVILSFIFLMWWITFIDLCMLNHPCISRMYPTWSWCIILLMGSSIWFLHILLRIFASIFIRGIGLQFSCDILFWLWCQASAGFMEWVWNYFLFLNILEEFDEDWY